MNVGEQFVSSYLQYIRGCDFIRTNLPTKSQGEIDVVGLNLVEKQVYICEVAIHLTTGLKYEKNNRPNNVEKLKGKFSRSIKYAIERWDPCDYDHHFMLWSPIVKNTKGKPENNQMQHLAEIEAEIKKEYDIEIEFIVNEKFQKCLAKLRNYVRDKRKTTAFQCPLMRLMQIEYFLDEHVSKLKKV